MTSKTSHRDFDFWDYVDLTHMQDPRLAKEMVRMLEHFASDPLGQTQIKNAALGDGYSKIRFSDDPALPNQYDPATHTININPNELASCNYYTSIDLTLEKTAPMTLGQAIWHEMDHAGDPVFSELVHDTEEFRVKVRANVAQEWAHDSFRMVYLYAKSNPENVSFSASNPALAHLPPDVLATRSISADPMVRDGIRFLSIDGMPAADFNARYIDLLTDLFIKHHLDEPASTPDDPFFKARYNDLVTMMVKVDGTFFENRAIASENAARPSLLPNEPARFSHLESENPLHNNPVQSGTLPPKKQAEEDAKFGYVPGSEHPYSCGAWVTATPPPPLVLPLSVPPPPLKFDVYSLSADESPSAPPAAKPAKHSPSLP